MGMLDDILAEVKKDPNKHYRLTRLESARMSLKRAEGYENVSASGPEIKGTTLERNRESDGSVRIGGLVLQSISKEQHEKLVKRVEDRTRAREASIKRNYLEEGERVKRGLGKKHRAIDFIAESKEE